MSIMYIERTYHPKSSSQSMKASLTRDLKWHFCSVATSLQKSWNIHGLVFVRSILSALSILAFRLADNRFLEEVVFWKVILASWLPSHIALGPRIAFFPKNAVCLCKRALLQESNMPPGGAALYPSLSLSLSLSNSVSVPLSLSRSLFPSVSLRT